MKKNVILLSVGIGVLVLCGLLFLGTREKKPQITTVSMMTDRGEIVMELRPDLMPKTVANFMKLVNLKFYDGLKFHRVERWVIQSGDPKGDGTGGPGWSLKLETNKQLKNVQYAVGMARSESPDSAGSQFYILKQDETSLDGQYAIFGKVVKGKEIVDKMNIGDKIIEVKEIK